MLLALGAGHAAEFAVGAYGAKADGAIDAAAPTGGTVIFGPGTYLTGSLFLKTGVRL